MKSQNSTQKRFTPGQFLGALAALFLGFVTVAYAVTVPNIFVAGGTISAAQVNSNFAAVNRKGYAWAGSEDVASYTPSGLYSFNSSGGAITATRSAIGVYAITFAGLGGVGGNVQVTAQATGAYCRVSSWNSLLADVIINIRCFDSTGAAEDSPYNVLFVT